ncbi:MAG: hypothetical protein INQ03_13865 [Candidatus Heimdallarchaeota archaeon]|nr:hypothetical protein [Candidatus Heimdallarchaeota archaeon]
MENPISNKSEYATIILGSIATLFLISGLTQLMKPISGGFSDITGLLMVFNHFIILLIALPFLLKGFKKDYALPMFRPVVQIISGVNTLLMVGIIFLLKEMQPIGYIVFIILTLLELLPFFLMQKYKLPVT